MRRPAVTAFLACVAAMCAACGSSSHPASAPTTAAQPSTTQTATCASQQQAGIAADFGRRRTVAAAHALLARAQRLGFKGLVVQRRNCHDFAVVFAGLSAVGQARGLQREAQSAGLKVTLECRSQPPRGDIVAVFGRTRTRPGAQRIAARATHVGFRGLDVVQVGCNDWHVVLHGLTTPAQRRALAAEARKVGIKVTYEPG